MFTFYKRKGNFAVGFCMESIKLYRGLIVYCLVILSFFKSSQWLLIGEGRESKNADFLGISIDWFEMHCSTVLYVGLLSVMNSIFVLSLPEVNISTLFAFLT